MDSVQPAVGVFRESWKLQLSWCPKQSIDSVTLIQGIASYVQTCLASTPEQTNDLVAFCHLSRSTLPDRQCFCVHNLREEIVCVASRSKMIVLITSTCMPNLAISAMQICDLQTSKMHRPWQWRSTDSLFQRDHNHGTAETADTASSAGSCGDQIVLSNSPSQPSEAPKRCRGHRH